jgi:integrase
VAGKRRFGRLRRLPSGRYQARYLGPDGIDRSAPHTFPIKRDAEVWLAKTEVEILGDQWLDPDAGSIPFSEYALRWIDERPNLRPKTVELYRYLLRRHLTPTFSERAVSEIREPHVRRWRKELLDTEVGAVTLAKAYRLLKAIMTTAVDDGLVARNPCRIKGAGQEQSLERPVLTIPQVFALAEAIDQRYRALVFLASFGSLRWGELSALRRCDVDLETRTVRVIRQLSEARGGGFTFGAPKSEAGKRVVAIPEVILPILQWHLRCFAQEGDEGLIFTSVRGRPLRHGHFRTRIWRPATRAVGLGDLHFHDLRHTGNTFAAAAGATLRELMDRMGHSTTRAALVYLHGSDERQQAIADALSKLATKELERSRNPANGCLAEADRARNGHETSRWAHEDHQPGTAAP